MSARSLADAIRAMDEDQLATLMRERPDLAQPRPTSMGDLVERAASATSTAQAVERLNRWLRRVAEGLAAMPEPVSARHLAAVLDADTGAVEAAIATLRRRALAWGSGQTVQVTRAAAAALGPWPAGLAGPTPAPLSPTALREALAEADEAEHRVLQQLLWEPRGRLRGATRPMPLGSARTPTERLLARRLVRPVDDEHVELVREAALHLREGRFFVDSVSQTPPPFPAPEQDATRARIRAQAAMGTALEAIETLTTVVEDLIALSPRVLSTGGLGRRDLKFLAEGRHPGATSLALALARQAGLVGTHGPHWLATPAFDRWAALDGWSQWKVLARAWTHLDRWPTAGTDPLLPDPTPGALRLRRAVLTDVHLAPEGTALDAGLLAERVQWQHPTWPDQPTREASEHVVTEATLLGIVALGAAGPLQAATDDPGFPPPTHQFVLQSDLTAAHAGPLQTDVRRRLALLTERHASTHRFTPASIRRGLDHGMTSEQLLDWLAAHSATPVPQPLAYLVADVARQHGQIRVMPAASVITIDEPAVLEALLRAPDASLLGLRKVGPQAVAAQADPEEVVEVLRRLGHAPVPTNERGEPLQAPVARRATRAAQPATEVEPPTREQLLLVARALLAQSSGRQGDDLPELLQHAQVSGDWVELTHVDARGVPSTERARVLAVQAGQVRIVRRASAPVTIPVSRVVRVAPASTP